MSWQRFEGKRVDAPNVFMLRLSSRHFSFNKLFFDQVLLRRPWVDVYYDPPAKRVGMRFTEKPSDLHSYKVSMEKNRNHYKAPRISAIKFTREIGIAERLGRSGQSFLVHHDPAEGIYWFDIAPLLNGGKP